MGLSFTVAGNTDDVQFYADKWEVIIESLQALRQGAPCVQAEHRNFYDIAAILEHLKDYSLLSSKHKQ